METKTYKQKKRKRKKNSIVCSIKINLYGCSKKTTDTLICPFIVATTAANANSSSSSSSLSFSFS